MPPEGRLLQTTRHLWGGRWAVRLSLCSAVVNASAVRWRWRPWEAHEAEAHGGERLVELERVARAADEHLEALEERAERRVSRETCAPPPSASREPGTSMAACACACEPGTSMAILGDGVPAAPPPLVSPRWLGGRRPPAGPAPRRRWRQTRRGGERPARAPCAGSGLVPRAKGRSLAPPPPRLPARCSSRRRP